MIAFRVSATDAVRLRDEFVLTQPASSLQELPDYTMYVRTLARGGSAGAGASPSGPHYVSGYPPFDRHHRHAQRESVIRVSLARYAKPRALVEDQLRRQFFTVAPKTPSDGLYNAKQHVQTRYKRS